MKHVWITGLGWLAPEAFADISTAKCDSPLAPEITAFETPEGAPTFGFECLSFRLEDDLPNFKGYLDRVSAMTAAACRRALRDAGLEHDKERTQRLGIAQATLFGGLDSMEVFAKKLQSASPKFAPPLPFTHGYANAPGALTCIELGLRGPAATFAGDGLCGLQALAFAFDAVADAKNERMLAVAGDALSRAAYAHWLASGKLNPAGRRQAAEAGRPNLIPGEGAAAVLLEDAEAAVARGAKPLAEICGLGLAATSSTAASAVELWEKAAVAADWPSKLRPEDSPLFVSAAPLPDKLEKGERELRRRFAAFGRWQANADVAPKEFCGESSAAPLLGVVLSALVLSGRAWSHRLPPISDASSPDEFNLACVCGGDAVFADAAGIVVLRRP